MVTLLNLHLNSILSFGKRKKTRDNVGLFEASDEGPQQMLT